MQNLFLEKNPFYILEASPYDKRANIISKAEEKAFFTDSGICEEAQAKLLHPEKRLSAELDWFYGVSKDEISRIHKCISAKKEISTDALKNISKLNATLHNLSIINYEDHFKIGYAILDVDEQYANIDVQSLLDVINVCHKQAGMREVSQEEIERELNAKRDQIKQIVLDKVENISKENYVELATMISEKCIADDNYEDGIVISDVINQYEIWAKSLMDTKEDDIRNCINSIREMDSDIKLKPLVKNLISLIKEWDMYAQPIQVNMAIKGIEDSVSRDIAIDIRDLAIYLHNEKGKTELSLEITEALKLYFAELAEVLEVVSEDAETLKRLQCEKEKFELKKKQNKHADKKYSVGIFGKRFVIPPFCTCCMKPTENKENVSYSITIPNGNMRTTRTIGIDMPICNECLKHRNKYIGLLVLICSAAITVAGIIMTLFMLAEVDGFFSFILSSGVAVDVYYLLSHLLKTKELGIEHSTRGKSAEIFSFFMGTSGLHNKMNLPDVTFTFTNWEYAHLFREANGEQAGDIKEKVEVNTAKSTSVLKANAHHVATMFKMLGTFAVVALIIGCIISESGNTSIYSSSSSYSSGSSSYGSSSSSVEKQFSQSVSPGTKVYANIVSIFPEKGIYTQGSSCYSSFVCKCKTSTGTTVWVHMPVSKYRNNFDSSASSSIYNEYAEEVTFSSSKKIHGTAKTSNSVLSGLSTDIGATILIDFTSVN